MSETDDKYKSILSTFNIKITENNIIKNYGYVTIDDIHDAIIYIDTRFTNKITLDNDLKLYKIKSKQVSIDRFKKNNKYVINLDNRKQELLLAYENNIDFLDNYDLSHDELILCLEIISGIPRYKSQLSKRLYKKIKEGLKTKLLN